MMTLEELREGIPIARRSRGEQAAGHVRVIIWRLALHKKSPPL